jgi:hypothetical protein
MTPRPERTERPRTIGHTSHEAQVRVDQRVREVVARRVALNRAQHAAQRINRAGEQNLCRAS